MSESGVLKVGALDDGVNRAGLLAETAENTFGHVNVVLGSAARTVGTGLRLDGDGESGASGLAELAGDATLLASGVPTQGMLASKFNTEGSLLPGVMDDVLNKGSGSKEKEGELTSGSKAAQVTWNQVGQSNSVMYKAAWVPS